MEFLNFKKSPTQYGKAQEWPGMTPKLILKISYLLMAFERGCSFFSLPVVVQSIPYSSIFCGVIYIFRERPYKFLLYLVFFVMINFLIFWQADYFPLIRQMTALMIGILFCLSIYHFEKNETGEESVFIIKSLFFVVFFLFQDLNSNPFRLKGTFTEPALFGDYLVLLIIPLLVLHKNRFGKNIFYLLIVFVISLTFLTFSTLSVARLLILFSCLVSCFFNFKRLITLILIFSSAIILILYLPPNHIQYGLHRIYDFVFSGGKLIFNFPSLVDRVYPIIYSVKSILNGHILGRGPGADWYFRNEVFDDNFLKLIIPYKQSTSIMNSFMAKMTLYWGVLPIILSTYWFYRIRKVIDFNSNEDRLYVAIALSTFINSFFGMANFSLPYFWFWAAIISVHFFKRTKYQST